jgi:hypothetical protein
MGVLAMLCWPSVPNLKFAIVGEPQIQTLFLWFQWPADPRSAPQNATGFRGRTLVACLSYFDEDRNAEMGFEPGLPRRFAPRNDRRDTISLFSEAC